MRVCVCPPSRLLITSGMMWLDIYNWLNQSYSFCMTAVVVIGGGNDLRIEVHHSNQT